MEANGNGNGNPPKRPSPARMKRAREEAAAIIGSGGGRASEPEVAARLAESGIPLPIAERMAREARELASAGRLTPPPPAQPTETAWVRDSDLPALSAILPSLPEAESRLLCAMLLCVRARPHPTGRVRYEDAPLMSCAGIRDPKAYRAAFGALAHAGLASCAVVGSKNPTPTLTLPWLPPEGAGDGEARPIPFGRGEGAKLAERLAGEVPAKE